MRFGLTTLLGSLTALAALAACETPDVAGNTVDTLNTLEAVYPDSANVNVSYRYAYQGLTQLRVDAVGEGQAHVYAGDGTDPPDRFVQVFISTPVEGYEPVATERLRFGDREFLSVIYCIQSPVEAEATGMAPFLRALSDLEITPPEIAYIRHFIPLRTEDDGAGCMCCFCATWPPREEAAPTSATPARPSGRTRDRLPRSCGTSRCVPSRLWPRVDLHEPLRACRGCSKRL